ncbi:hypothetical protein MMC22_003902 [Lobaria immixta]|nr:hypothetical protein [Lobaria immixta]
MSRQGQATAVPQSRGGITDAQSGREIVDRVHGSGTGGPASTGVNNDGNDNQVHRSASIDKGQGLPPLASTQTSSRNQYPQCPYHGPILRMTSSHHSKGQGLDPMSRFLAEGPSDQHALFIRPDTGALSTSRGCTCRAGLEGVSH